MLSRLAVFFLILIHFSLAGNGNALYFTPPPQDTIVVRFEYKQSALYQAYTKQVMDSVVTILKSNAAINIYIDGYAHMDEGNDTVVKYLSLNRAIFVKEYVLGRGIDPSRIISVNGFGASRPYSRGIDKNNNALNCRAEIVMAYPPPPPKIVVLDSDEDGIPDGEDQCPQRYGYAKNKGCPDSNVVIVPFDNGEANLMSATYKILDSVIVVLRSDPAITLSISGHAYRTEGSRGVCNRLAQERAEVVKAYLYSRNINMTRVDLFESLSDRKPLNAGKTPKEIVANSRAEILLNRH